MIATSWTEFKRYLLEWFQSNYKIESMTIAKPVNRIVVMKKHGSTNWDQWPRVSSTSLLPHVEKIILNEVFHRDRHRHDVCNNKGAGGNTQTVEPGISASAAS